MLVECIKETTPKEKKELFNKFINYYKKYEKSRNIAELRLHSMWFKKGLKNAKSLRAKLMKLQTIEEILDLYQKELKST